VTLKFPIIDPTSRADGDHIYWDSAAGVHKYEAPGGGGGALTHAYVGTSTPGATTETMLADTVYLKQVTLASAGYLAAIEAHVRSNSGGFRTFSAAVYSDDTAAPDLVLAAYRGALGLVMQGGGGAGTGEFRWLASPVGIWLPAADYWIAVAQGGGGAVVDIKVDLSAGTDKTYNPVADGFTDIGFQATSTTTSDYSIRASILT
jgi:hypothetical protein